MIEVEGLTKRFGSTQALADFDLAAEEGRVLALLGPNGAGKTTLVRILATLLRPDSGRATVAGCDVIADAARLRSLIGLTGQFAAVDELLTGRENLELVGLFYHLSKTERRRRAQDVLERFTLTDAAEKLVKTYSGGMRRRLDVGASLIGRPRVLFLDEPTTGLDPRTRNDVWQLRRGSGRRRHDGVADDPVHGGGGAPRPPHRRDRRRARRGAGDRRRAQGRPRRRRARGARAKREPTSIAPRH